MATVSWELRKHPQSPAPLPACVTDVQRLKQVGQGQASEMAGSQLLVPTCPTDLVYYLECGSSLFSASIFSLNGIKNHLILPQ